MWRFSVGLWSFLCSKTESFHSHTYQTHCYWSVCVCVCVYVCECVCVCETRPFKLLTPARGQTFAHGQHHVNPDVWLSPAGWNFSFIPTQRESCSWFFLFSSRAVPESSARRTQSHYLIKRLRLLEKLLCRLCVFLWATLKPGVRATGTGHKHLFGLYLFGFIVKSRGETVSVFYFL